MAQSLRNTSRNRLSDSTQEQMRHAALAAGTAAGEGTGRESMEAGRATYYYLADGLGSTMAIVDDTGTVQKSFTYDVYGKPTATGTLANEFDFAGQQTDPTGLQYLRARYMDPETGVFLSRDPFADNPAWLSNAHGYADSNPANMVDPSGTFSIFPPGCFFGFGLSCGDDDDGPPELDEECTGWNAYTSSEKCLKQRQARREWVDEQAAELVALIGEYIFVAPRDGAPTRLTGITKHGGNQAISRENYADNGRFLGYGVKTSAIRQALKHPTRIVRIWDDETNWFSWRYYGKDAWVALNDAGELITTKATTRAGVRFR